MSWQTHHPPQIPIEKVLAMAADLPVGASLFIVGRAEDNSDGMLVGRPAKHVLVFQRADFHPAEAR